MTIEINSSIAIRATKEEIFQVVSDHEGTPNWVDEVKCIKLIKEGTPKNGKGAIREVHFKPLLWNTVQERIIHFEPNTEYQYKVVKMPGLKDHLGTFYLEDTATDLITLRWTVHMEFKKYHPFSLFANKFKRDFKIVQEKGFQKLKERLES